MDLRRMAILVAVVDSGSMRRAARELGLTPSAVSQQLRQLERETGVTLLRRSTRQLALTDAGQAFYEGCAAMLATARSAYERITALHEGVTGELSVSAPVAFATPHLMGALIPLLQAHPELSLRVVTTDDPLDLVRERIDLAIAIGTQPPAQSLVRRHLADWENVLVASPGYLAVRGTPHTLDDLADHDFLALPAWHHPSDVLISPDGLQHRVPVKRRVTSNNQLAIRQLAIAGYGLSFNSMPEIREELADRRLVQVLPDWSLPVLSVDALMPPRTKQPAKVRAAIDALTAYLAQLAAVKPSGKRLAGSLAKRRVKG